MNAQRVRIALFVLVIAQLIVIGAIVASHYATSVYGKKVRIATIPVDPRDVFYGDYVVLRYTLSTFVPEQWHADERPTTGMKVYAWLREKDGLFEATRFTHEQPPAGTLSLRGRIVSEYEDASGKHYDVAYGIERFYVPEGTGGDIEAYAGQAIATVRIARWGQLHLESVSPRS